VLVAAPLGLLLPALVLMGCVAMSWNGLAFAATAEMVGYERSGAATGIQQTVVGISGSLLLIVFGALVAASSWRAGFAVSALFPVAGWWVLRALPG
jgi:hypothetical protein